VHSFAVLVATVGGLGRLPLAPGTAGSLAALPLLPPLAALRTRSLVAAVCAVVAVAVLAIWASECAEDVLGGHDESRIVIDEVAGLVLAGLFLPPSWAAAAIAFVLFRVLDVVKPFPAGLIDKRVEGGLGVVGDDLVAGLYAGLLTGLVLRIV
jgi:phosphatidylglycerophosphatase A